MLLRLLRKHQFGSDSSDLDQRTTDSDFYSSWREEGDFYPFWFMLGAPLLLRFSGFRGQLLPYPTPMTFTYAIRPGEVCSCSRVSSRSPAGGGGDRSHSVSGTRGTHEHLSSRPAWASGKPATPIRRHRESLYDTPQRSEQSSESRVPGHT